MARVETAMAATNRVFYCQGTVERPGIWLKSRLLRVDPCKELKPK